MDPDLAEAQTRINSSLEHLKMELSSIRAGRANPALIENVPIKVYGSVMKLLELGTISAPQPTLLTIQLWDATIIQDVVKGIQEANLGLNPSNDGTLIRLPIPPLTLERRAEFIKMAREKLENTRVNIRQIRQEVREDWKRAQEAGGFGEDEFERRSKLLQDLVDKTMGIIMEMGKQKQEELSEI